MRDKANLSCRKFYKLSLVLFIWIALLTSIADSSTDVSNSIQPSVKSGSAPSETVERTYKLPPPGEDPRTPYLTSGENAFRSRDYEKAREAFEKVLQLDSQNPQAHYFLGLIEYEEGNIEGAKAKFQKAHECLLLSLDDLKLPIDDKQTQIEFFDDYEVRVYYKDGWYLSPKDPLASHKDFYPLDAGSTYKVKLLSIDKESWIRRSLTVGTIVILSFFLAR